MKKITIELSGHGEDCFIHEINDKQFEKFEDKEVEDGEMSLSQVLKVLKKNSHTETESSVFGPNPDTVSLYIKDENGSTLFEYEDNWEFQSVQNEDGVLFDEPNLLYISESLKGIFYSFTLELENEFDISKLNPIITEVGESIELITGLIYDGKKLNADSKLIDMEGEGGYNFYLTFTN
jgi:hypothetical protein